MKPFDNFRILRFRDFLYASLLLLSTSFSTFTMAQDVEPRRWTNLPLGMKAAGVGYGYTFGDVLFDPLLEVEDATVKAHTAVVSYVQPFRIGKKFARMDVLVPFSTARWEGILKGEPASVERTGLVDPRIRISYHLFGPPALKSKELQEYFATHPTYTTLGVSLGVNLPLGQYDEDKLINLGLNQFVFRPQVGVSHNWGLWSVEVDASVFIYTKNNSFFNNGNKRQDPLFATQAHLIKRFKAGVWAALSTGYGLGGTSRINRLSKDDERSNLLNSASLGFSITKLQSVKVVYLHSETLKDIGSNTHSIVLAYSILFK
jgi:Putative MetA-pathway of phenol degradation